MSTDALGCLQLATHLPRIHLDQPGFDRLGIAPDRVVDLLLAQHLRGVAKKQLEDLVFPTGRRHDVAPDRHLARGAVHAEVARLEDLDLRGDPAPAQRSNASEHLLEVEGLGEVVVGAGVEAGEPVLDVVASGEHEDRRRRPL